MCRLGTGFILEAESLPAAVSSGSGDRREEKPATKVEVRELPVANL
jgi:hypothetical protein